MNIYLAAFFVGKINPQDGIVESGFKLELTSLIHTIREHGHAVFSAHEREGWSTSLMPAEVCTPLVLAGTDDCDLVIAIPGNPASRGVHIEIGYTTAKKKPIILVRKMNRKDTMLLDGLQKITKTDCIYYQKSLTEIVPYINKSVIEISSYSKYKNKFI